MAHNSGSNKNFPGNAVGIEFANDDQRTSKGRNTNPSGGAYAEGKKSSQDTNDIKDQRSMGNRIADAKLQNAEAKKYDVKSNDPTDPAVMHGNEPSKGAKIDKALQEEDEVRLRQKGGA